MSFEDMMKELQKEYIENLPNKITAIQSHFEKMDVTALEDAFHKIKGTGKTYGVPELSTLAKVLEKACKDDHNVKEILPPTILVLKKIETSRKDGNEFKIEDETLFEDILKIAS